MARKVILDVDPGIDDALAVALALFDPQLDVLAVTATGGNVEPQQATRNVQTILEQLDPPRLPRLGAAPLDIPLPEDGRQLHGTDGLGQAGFPVAELHNIHPAEKVLCDEVRAAPEEITIIASGPLTNIARAMQSRSEFRRGGGPVDHRRRHGRRSGQCHSGRRIQYVLRSAFGPHGDLLADDEDASSSGDHEPIRDDLRSVRSTAAGEHTDRRLPAAGSAVCFPRPSTGLGTRRDLHRWGVGRGRRQQCRTVRIPRNGRRCGNPRRIDLGRDDLRPPPNGELRPNIDVVTNLDLAAVKDCLLRTLAAAARAG